MADTVTGRFLYFDSTNEVITQFVKMQSLYWVSNDDTNRDIAAADVFLLKDADGNEVFGKVAEAAGDGLELDFGYQGFPIQGIDIETLDGGVVWIILKDEITS